MEKAPTETRQKGRQERPRTATEGISPGRRGQRGSTERSSSPGHFRPRTPVLETPSQIQGGQNNTYAKAASGLRQETRVVANPAVYKRSNTAPQQQQPVRQGGQQGNQQGGQQGGQQGKHAFGARGRAPPISTGAASTGCLPQRPHPAAVHAVGRGKLKKANSDGIAVLKPRPGSTEASSPRIRVVGPSAGRGAGAGRGTLRRTGSKGQMEQRTAQSPGAPGAKRGPRQPPSPAPVGAHGPARPVASPGVLTGRKPGSPLRPPPGAAYGMGSLRGAHHQQLLLQQEQQQPQGKTQGQPQGQHPQGQQPQGRQQQQKQGQGQGLGQGERPGARAAQEGQPQLVAVEKPRLLASQKPQLLAVQQPEQRSSTPGKVRSRTIASPSPAQMGRGRGMPPAGNSPTRGASPAGQGGARAGAGAVRGHRRSLSGGGLSGRGDLSPQRPIQRLNNGQRGGKGGAVAASGNGGGGGSISAGSGPGGGGGVQGGPKGVRQPVAKQSSPISKRPSEASNRPGRKRGGRSQRGGMARAATLRGCTMDATRLREGPSAAPSAQATARATPVQRERKGSAPPEKKLSDGGPAPPIPVRVEETHASLYGDLSQRQSVLLEQLDKQWSDADLFGEVSNADSESEDEDEAEIVEEFEADRPTSDSSKVLLKELNIELPEAYTTLRKSRRSSVKPTDWEGWQRRVKRQTWEEWEIRLTPKPLMGMKGANTAEAIVSQLQARNEVEVDGRAVVPYWLMRWWLTKNTTNRPTISKHPLLELLLEDNMAVVAELAKVMKGVMLSNLSVALVRIFDGCAKVIPLIVHFVKSEVAQTLHQSTLFRTNTITTKVMSAYAKIAGAPYLRKNIGPFLTSLVEKNVSVEVDQKKLTGGDLLETNLAVLLEKTQELLDIILGSVDEVPFMLRQICACLSRIVREKFPEAEHFSVAGFMFLRFLCPAIVAPDAFGVVKTAPSSAVRRTLVLMSKVVQNLANGTEHAKEEYMQPTDVFVATNLSRIRTYFKHISDLSRVPLDKVDVNFTIIPVPLVEESLTIVHRMIIKNIDVLKESLKQTEVTETVEYQTYENVATVLLKSSMSVEQLKSGEQVLASSPLFKPYALLIDVLLANGCKVMGTLLQNKRSERDRKLIAEELMIVVHTHGNALQFVKSLVTREVLAAGSTAASFPESSLGTWLIFGYFKLLVRDFITTYWRTTMESIMATNVCTEVDRAREADADAAQAVRSLEAVTDQLLEPLFEHALELPSRLFELCHHVQEEVAAKFRAVDPLFSAKLLCEKIFILAVSYPMLFHMTEDLPKFNARRTLVLASGIVRHCFLGGRFQEESLQPLNAIVEKHAPAAAHFLQSIIEHRPEEAPLLLPWSLQRTVLINIYAVLQKELLTLKATLADNTTVEHITYNIFDRLAAVIALYRYRLRVRTQKFSANEYSDSVSRR